MPTPQQYDQIIYDTARKQNLSDTLAKLLVSQARYETGDYQNNAFINYNNAFGYKYVAGGKYQLPQPGNTSSEGDQYAAYASLKDSTLEVIAWLQRREKEGKFTIASITTPEQYASALKIGNYYGQSDTAYAKGLIQKLTKISVNALTYAKNHKGKVLVGMVAISTTIYLAIAVKKGWIKVK